MQIINGLHNLRAEHKGCVVTIGNFDGVHHGHQVLLHHLVAKSRELGVPSTLVTFEPQPREYFAGAKVPARLTRFREKVALLRKSELDRLLCLPFNEKTSNTPARWFTREFLRDLLGARYVVVGDDFRFGRGREGDYAMLKAAGDEFGYGVSHVGTLTFDHERVSSTRVREALADGDLALAERLLGHEYFIMGRVVYGRQLGKELGVPTANIKLQRYRAALNGVFCVTVEGLQDRVINGIANIGVRPTVDGKEPLLEVHLFDFEGDIYGKLISVTFKLKIREEHAFPSLDALKEQINADLVTAREWFAHG